MATDAEGGTSVVGFTPRYGPGLGVDVGTDVGDAVTVWEDVPTTTGTDVLPN